MERGHVLFCHCAAGSRIGQENIGLLILRLMTDPWLMLKLASSTWVSVGGKRGRI